MAAMNALARIPPPPLKFWVDGTIRVGSSEVRVDLVLQHYKQGATAEQIRQHCPSLALGDIYRAIIYYLEHVEGIEGYLAEQEERQAEEDV
ncbi:conserved hypothetical protein [Acidobacteriia bacterium SbA2]|nr:conserved hypothetical protein [Acidobacteriia bacterium SbA2]